MHKEMVGVHGAGAIRWVTGQDGAVAGKNLYGVQEAHRTRIDKILRDRGIRGLTRHTASTWAGCGSK